MILNVTISWHGTTVTILWSPLPVPFIELCFVVPNVIIMIGLILAQYHRNNIAATSAGTIYSTRLWRRSPIPAPNVIPFCTIFVASNIIIMIGLILVTASNTFPDCLFINSHCVHAVFERNTDREWHNSSGTSSKSRDDSLVQSCQGVGNSKTRTLHQ